jgi:glutamate carboxypeptidase
MMADPAPALALPAAARGILDQAPADLGWWRARVTDWCDRNTGSRNTDGLMGFLPVLEEAFGALPGDLERVALGPETVIGSDGAPRETALCPALRVSVRPEAPIRIALTGHYDTVFPAESAFQRVVEREPGVLNGPGVADMKGGLLVMLEALRLLEASPWAAQIGYEILISPDEEIGSPGSAPLLAALGARCDLGMTYEPALADGSLSGARKGSGNFALVVRGRAAHVGRAHAEGRSAIAAAARFSASLEALNGAREGVTFNVGKIDGGGPTNVVPDLAIVRFNIRAPDPAAVDWATEQTTALIASLEKSDGLSASLHGGFTRPAKPRTAGQAVVFAQTQAAGVLLGLPIAFKDTGGVCEGNNLAASGCANVDTLGPRGGLIHSDQEFAILESFPERVRLSAALLLGYATGALDAAAPRRALGLERLG